MSTERPIEIDHLPPQLHADFDGLIPRIANPDPEHVETNFCSRALAAYAVHKITGCSLADAAGALVDGGGDGGIDAVHYAPESSTLWCIQSKYTKDGLSEPVLGEVSKFADGVDALLQGNLDSFRANPYWNAKLPQIEHLMSQGGVQIRAVLVYSGLRLVSDDRRRLFECLKTRHSPDDDSFGYESYNLTSIHDWIVGAEEIRGVGEVEICIKKPGWLKTPHEVVYGVVLLSDLLALAELHGDRLVASNIRRYKGSTEVNGEIARTLTDEPESFLYLNNGLTAYCDRLEVPARDRGNAEEKKIKAFGFSIVNGAQTLGTLRKTLSGNPPANGYAFLRVISMERCAEDRQFAERITRCTNTQNEILARDYVALDPEQERIANQLSPSGVTYHYKLSDDTVPQDPFNFTILEATTAAACLVQDSTGAIYSTILGNRKSLWDTDCPDGQTWSPYARVFPSSLSARTLWRAVQAQRVVLEKLREFARAEPQRRAFFENGRWIVLNLVFLRYHPENGEALGLTADEIQQVADATLTLSEELWAVVRSLGLATDAAGGGFHFPRHLKSVFCDKEDCRRLRSGTLRRLQVNDPGQLAETPNHGVEA